VGDAITPGGVDHNPTREVVMSTIRQGLALFTLLAAAGGGVLLASPASAESNAPAARPMLDCRYSFSSVFPGPNRETQGDRYYPEGATDPEGRTCTNGWWTRGPANLLPSQGRSPFGDVGQILQLPRA
jgi:hypothetical protein